MSERPATEMTTWDAAQWQENAHYWYEQAQEAYRFRDALGREVDTLTARLARVEALADEWERKGARYAEKNHLPGSIAESYANRLRAALASDPTHAQDGGA